MSVIIGYPSGGTTTTVSVKEYIAKLLEDGKTLYYDTNPFVYKLFGYMAKSKKIVVYASNPNEALGGVYHYINDDLKVKYPSDFAKGCYNNPDICDNAFDNNDYTASTWQFAGNDGEKDLVDFLFRGYSPTGLFIIYFKANFLDYVDDFCLLTKFGVYFEHPYYPGWWIKITDLCPQLNVPKEYWIFTNWINANHFKITGLNNSANPLRIQLWEVRLYFANRQFPLVTSLDGLLNHVIVLANDFFRVYEVDYVE